MTNKPNAMNNIRSILKKLEREKSSLYKAYEKRILYTVQINRVTGDREHKLSDLIELQDEHIHSAKEYISDLVHEAKYELAQYDTEIDTKVREYIQTLDKL